MAHQTNQCPRAKVQDSVQKHQQTILTSCVSCEGEFLWHCHTVLLCLLPDLLQPFDYRDRKYPRNVSLPFMQADLSKTDCIKKSRVSDCHAFCEPCCLDFSIGHGGFKDVTEHRGSTMYQKCSRALTHQPH